MRSISPLEYYSKIGPGARDDFTILAPMTYGTNEFSIEHWNEQVEDA